MNEQSKPVVDTLSPRCSGGEALEVAGKASVQFRNQIEVWVNEGGAGGDVA